MHPPMYTSADITLHHGDARTVLPTLPDASADAVITDPPYEIGIAGHAWDRTGIAYDPTMWAECLRILKPGGHLLAFGATRTYHRMVCAVEDAGFQIRDQIDWVYGQGYPAGKHALKPAHDPILVARRPLEGTLTATMATTGLGGLHIDECRLGTGRWPTNLILGHARQCTELCTPGCPVADLDGQSGTRTSGSGAVRTREGHFMGNGGLGRAGDVQVTYGDTGGASRYFPVLRFESREASGRLHPTQKPLALMRWLVRLATPPGGLVLDPFAGSGSTMVAAAHEGRPAVGVEADLAHAVAASGRLSEPIQAGLDIYA